MKKMSLMMAGRTALAGLVLAPTAACADPADQPAPPRQHTPAQATGIPVAAFIARHEKTLLADDTDGDGKISRAEFLAAAKTGRSDPAKRFARLDTNGDGMIDTSEIEAMLSRRFTRLDTNGDGLLSAAERAAARDRKARDTACASQSLPGARPAPDRRARSVDRRSGGRKPGARSRPGRARPVCTEPWRPPDVRAGHRVVEERNAIPYRTANILIATVAAIRIPMRIQHETD